MKKKLWEMAVGILYILIMFYQVAKTENVKVVCEIPGEALAGSRIRAVLDLSGCRGKYLVLRLSYDESRLDFCGKAGVRPVEGSFLLVREVGLGAEEEHVLEISVFLGQGYSGRGSVTLEFYAKQNCRNLSDHIKLMGVKENLCYSIDNDFRKNYNGGNGFAGGFPVE